MSAVSPIIKVLACSVAASVRAGGIIRSVLSSGNLGVVEKGINDLQTEADRSAQNLIVGALHHHFPSLKVIGEEEMVETKLTETVDLDPDVLSRACPTSLQSISLGDMVVWVDPLDGTSEFTQGLLDHVTVLIGIAVKEKTVAGVIYQPYWNYKEETDLSKQGRCVWALEGLGVFGIDLASCQVPPGNIITTTRSHSNDLVTSALEACEPTQVLKVGGCGHKVLLLIERKAHAYLFASPGCKKWDTCAPEAVLRVAGGDLTDIKGRPLPYGDTAPHPNLCGVLATLDRSKHQWYLDRIPQAVKDSMKD